MGYKAVIFDLDGTLLESTADHLEWLYTAVEQALEEVDPEIDLGSLTHHELEVLAGIQGYRGFEEKCHELGLNEKEFWFYVSHFRARQKFELLDQDLLHLVDGVEQVLQSIRSQGIDTAVVSNAPDPTVEEVVRYFDLDPRLEFFRGVTDLEDMKHRKPDPSHIELAVEELHDRNAVYVGDSVLDVEAAEKTGMDSILIGEDDRATFTVEDLEEVPDRME